MGSRKLSILGLFTLALGVFVLVGVMTPSSASAGGGVGGGGTPGGCGSCSGQPHTNNGYGWYKFSSTGGGPGDFKNGGPWSYVSNLCRSTGNDSVIMFIIERPTGGPGNARVYDYVQGDYGTYYHYKGNDGGGWLPYGTASSLFYSLPAGLRGGYTFGRNVAWFCYNFANHWSINGQSYIQKGAADISKVQKGTITAQPGDRLNWYHDLRNSGPDPMDKQIYFNVDKTGFSNGWNGIKAPTGYASGVYNQLFVAQYATYGSPYTLYDVTQNDVGNTLCQRISWNPASWNNGGWGSSGFACAQIPYSYALTPTITNISDGDVIESASGSVPVRGLVSNSGNTKSHPNIQWQITQVKYTSSASVTRKAGGVSPDDPCRYFIGNKSCDAIASGNEAGGYGYNASKPYPTNGNLGDEPVGTQLCYVMSIKRNSSSSADWRHSKLYCLTVGKRPKVQVWGSDLIVGRGLAMPSNVQTGVTQQQVVGKMYGSWAEYGILPSGTILGMASASGYGGGQTLNTPLCTVSLLSFANASKTGCSDSAVGKYTLGSGVTASIAGRFPATSSTPTIPTSGGTADIKDAGTGTYTYSGATLSVKSTADIGGGKWVVLNAPKTTVTISGDISYSAGPYTSIANLPQVLIIAKNIIIADNVTHIDAWLVATGTGADGRINTCGAGGVSEATLPNASQCGAQLRVNGPVMANHLYLRRTAGAGTGTQAGDPGEIFNLRPDAYLWASNLQRGAGKATTVMTTEMPPRF